MYKKTLLIFLAAVLTAHAQPPLAPPPNIHQFKVRYTYSCKGNKGTREVLVDADDEGDARAIVENMIPCAVITKITEVVLYQE
jgi:hypothetical protein